ncbi:hypothetical protein ES702_06625 [subsurface metagenome]
MAKRHWEDREQMRASLGSQGKWAHVWWFIGVIFAVVGIIGDAANVTLGLEPTSWFLLAIVAFLASITYFIGLAISWYLETKEAKKGE